MKRRVAATLVALAVPFLLGSATGSATTGAAAKGFTLRVSIVVPTVPTDPAFLTGTYFGIERAVCSTLIAYEDTWAPSGTQLVPEVAAAMPKVSKKGRVYRFTLRKSFRFSTGERVTARSFADAINRDLNPQLASPAPSFLAGVLKGADEVLARRATRAAGVKTKGRWTLVLELARRTPDFLHRLTLPLFCPVPAGTPAVAGQLKAFPSSGPYYYATYTPRQTLALERNPHYGGSRLHRASRILWSLGVDFNTMRLQWDRGDVDFAFMSPAVSSDIPRKYGVNRRRFWKAQTASVSAFVFNNDRPLFHGNRALRKAINYLIDRRQMKNQIVTLSGRRTDQTLSTAMRGFRDVSLYPLGKPNIAKARQLAKGHTGSGKAIILQANVTPGAQGRALILQAALRTIGIEATVELDNPLAPRNRSRGTSWDISDTGIPAPYLDPGAALSAFFDGRKIRDKNNTNVSYLNASWVNRRLDAAERLSGKARLRAYGKLDVDIMRREAPVAPYANFAFAHEVSSRVGFPVLPPTVQMNWGSVCLRRG